MRLVETELAGAWTVDIEPISDDRGFFARWYCRDVFAEHGLDAMDAQGNLSFNPVAGTIRGLHLQRPPSAEAKLMRCSKGAIFDVIVDCRQGSPTQWRWLGVELSAENRRALYVPKGFAHGYQTLVDDTDVFYLVSEPYTPGAEDGLRYDDPSLEIEWPLPPTLVSSKDREWPLRSNDAGANFGVDA
ncbi:MAG: dTDP-4-dehydrorhamnose 3,5-epimerase [Acidimicrobiales bacterium]